MAHLNYRTQQHQSYHLETREHESVLEAFQRQGITIPFSCRSGVCHVCLQKCTDGDIPSKAQKGLSPELKTQGYFMPCMCVPDTDMQIVAPSDLFQSILVHHKQMLSPYVCRILLEPPEQFSYKAGQFINLRRPDGVTRSYSLASLPSEDYFLEIHVQRKDGGIMSNWLIDELHIGDAIEIQQAQGDCYYQADTPDQAMLLIATGTGLAPLCGIVRDALHQGHQNEIHLYHGGHDEDRFYLRNRLRVLEQLHSNFHYHECVSNKPLVPFFCEGGRAHEVAFSRHQHLADWQVYLAGLTEMVDSGAALAAHNGAKPEHIHSDAFSLRDLRATKREAPKCPVAHHDKAKYPPTDAELWSALQEGKLLSKILADFYTRVYADEKLSAFFVGVTKQRLIEKQYLFIRQILTGEKIYFGDRPRNTHHWMVISDALFDYRAAIMLDCLRAHGLSEAIVQRFHQMEEFYRPDIVKTAAFPKMIGDIELPLEGFEEIILDVGALCDSCAREVDAQERVIYHLRLGKIYCADCSTHQHTPAMQHSS